MKLFNFEKKFFAADESGGGSSDFLDSELLLPNDDIQESIEDDIDFTKVADEFEEPPVETPPVKETTKEETTPPAVEEKTELQLLQEQNALLMERLNLLQDQINGNTPKTESKVEPPKETEAPAKKESEGPIDIFAGQDFDDVLSDKEKFIGMLARYGQVVMQETYKTIATTLPNIVNEQVTYQSKTKKMADEFYAANEDLAAVKPTVSAVMQTVIAENPGKGMDEILAKTAEKTRQLLGLRPKANVTPDNGSIPPAAPNTGSKRVTNAPRRMDVSEELEALKNLGF